MLDKLEKPPDHRKNHEKWLKFPYEINDVDPATNRQLLGHFTGERSSFVQVGPKKWFFPSGYRRNAEFYYNFKARRDDVWIVTFPRSGTTWTQEMVWLLANDLDYNTALEVPLENRSPFLEFNAFVHPKIKEELLELNKDSKENCELVEEIVKPAYIDLAKTDKRRFIKTHLPFELLPPNLLQIGCKIIYVARNPKDVAVSFYHLNRLFRTQGYVGDFPQYWHYFRNNLQAWTPYWEHIKQGWEKRHEENLLFLFYENMSKDLQSSIRQVSNFLNKSYTDDEYRQLEDHLKFDNFKNNKSVGLSIFKELQIIHDNEASFVRKGKTGGWKDYFDGALNQQADKWIEENSQKIGIKFPEIQQD